MNQLSVQRLNKDFNTTFLGPPNILAAFPRQSLPPLSKATCLDSCDAVPFSVIVIHRGSDRKFLRKGQNVGAQAPLPLALQALPYHLATAALIQTEGRISHAFWYPWESCAYSTNVPIGLSNDEFRNARCSADHLSWWHSVSRPHIS